MNKNKINKKKSLLKEAQKYESEPAVKVVKKHSFFGGFLTKIIIILFLLVILLGGGYFIYSKMTTPVVEKNFTTVSDELLRCQEFVTLKYRYCDIAAVKKSIKISKSYSIVKYYGIIRAGIEDISKCEYEIYNDGKGLKIHLPPSVILGNEIENQEVFDESHSIFVPISLEEVFNEIDNSRRNYCRRIIRRSR